jgi:hypothetical protein
MQTAKEPAKQSGDRYDDSDLQKQSGQMKHFIFEIETFSK